ncbi:G5 and 3D domain-containing protein [Oceanobacillus sp. Castelsardo]|uniref:G5 and 3D domain-containing protein n=1 Tax=Oceanobacillus sp. Castelsardo TaxID=1851204 RepID=UPI000838F86A|nr:G5 and 3D domain-containing protein [Oceanobacillus sp. Castelsardo]
MRFLSKLLPASKMKLVISSIGVLALVLFTSMVVFELMKVEVTMTSNGEEKKIKTHKNTVGELLDQEGIEVGDYDELSHNLNAKIEDGMEIEYESAKQLVLNIDGKTNTYYSTAQTLKEFIEELGLSFSKYDEVSLQNNDILKDGQEIKVKKAFEVTVNDGGKEKSSQVTGGTVKDLLEESKIELNKLDKISPSLDDEVTKDTSVTITRVEKKEEKLEEEIAFDTETKKDSSLEKGKEKVMTEGKKGKVLKTFEVTLENGEEVSRELLDEAIQEEKVDRVVAVGTKEPAQMVSVTSTSSSSSQASSGKTISVTASAFTASCSGCSGYTATGINLKANPNKKVIAVDPNVIPLGSRVWVEGYGEAIAGDTGGNIKGSRIDVHVPNKSKAHSWGVRNVQVKILD